MGAGGRPPKPTQLKVLQGTDRPDRANPAEPKPAGGVPDIPVWLPVKARRYWKQLAPILDDMKVLTSADGTALALLASVLLEYVTAQAVVLKEGLTYESFTEHGRIIRPRPEVAIAADAWRRAWTAAAGFGLNPSARSKVNRVGDGPESDPAEDFFNARNLN